MSRVKTLVHHLRRTMNTVDNKCNDQLVPKPWQDQLKQKMTIPVKGHSKERTNASADVLARKSAPAR